MGLESGKIPDDQLSSSSSSYSGFEPFKARLNSGAAWCMQENSYSEYLQIDVLTPHVIQQVCSPLEGLCLVLNCQEEKTTEENEQTLSVDRNGPIIFVAYHVSP